MPRRGWKWADFSTMHQWGMNSDSMHRLGMKYFDPRCPSGA